MHAVDRHWMPYRHAAGTDPALGLVPAGLACENQQSGREHLEPNLQAVAPLSGCVRHSPHLWIQYNSIGREGGVVCLERIYARAHTHSSSEDGGVAGFGAGQRCCSEHTRGAPSSSGGWVGGCRGCPLARCRASRGWRSDGACPQRTCGAQSKKLAPRHAPEQVPTRSRTRLLPGPLQAPLPAGQTRPGSRIEVPPTRGTAWGCAPPTAWRVVQVAAGTTAGSSSRAHKIVLPRKTFCRPRTNFIRNAVSSSTHQ